MVCNSNADGNSEKMIEKVISIRRITKVVKGGRILRFAVLVVVGDQSGSFGIGKSKAKETMVAIQKAIIKAKKHLFNVPFKRGTINHEVNAKYGASRVVLLPATRGKGLVANYSIRAVLDAIGFKNINAKCYGSTNPLNIILATIKGLMQMEEIEDVCARRGISPLRLL